MRSVPEAPQGLAMGPVAVAGWGRWQWRAGAGGSGGPAAAKKLAQHAPSNAPPAKKFALQA